MPLRKLHDVLRLESESGRTSDSRDARYVATTLARQDESVVLALAKRTAGQTLSRKERILLAAEDAGMTPEHQMQVLHRVSDKPGRNSLSAVNAVNAAAQLVGDHAQESDRQIAVHVTVGALWTLTTPDSERGETVSQRSALGITVDPTQVDD